MLSSLLLGCGALDESKDESTTDSPPVATAEQLSGLWIGTSEDQGSTETLDTTVVFLNEKLYLLRFDEAQVGAYTVLSNGSAALETDQYTYASPDTDNHFYVGTRSNTQFDMDALFATSTDLFINYDGNNRSGSATLELDTAQVDNLTLLRISGQWETTDAIMYINDEGGLQGSNSATGCQWKGNLEVMNDTLLTLNIERKLCPDFNQTVGDPVEGIAFIDGEGLLHFIAEQPNQILWMQFESATGAAPTTDPETEDEAAETEEAA